MEAAKAKSEEENGKCIKTETMILVSRKRKDQLY